eukprot:scaffold75125_cov50-Attheya_sp.AAC.1
MNIYEMKYQEFGWEEVLQRKGYELNTKFTIGRIKSKSTWGWQMRVGCRWKVLFNGSTKKEMLCSGAEHAMRIDCKWEEEDIICITVVDDIRSIYMSATRVDRRVEVEGSINRSGSGGGCGWGRGRGGLVGNILIRGSSGWVGEESSGTIRGGSSGAVSSIIGGIIVKSIAAIFKGEGCRALA